MKNIKSIQLLFVSALFLIITFSSCKKKDDTTTPVSTTGTLMFHLHTLADTTEVDSYGDTIIMTGGRQITVTAAQLYISNIKLIKTDGTVIDGTSTTIFMKQGTEEYDLGTVAAGNYKSVRFDIGLSNSQNSSTPATSDAILYQPSMWFGATAQPDGFVFVNFQGTIDTTNAATGTNLIPFAYKIGTTAHRVTVTMPDKNFTVTPDQQSIVHMVVDYAHILSGVQLNVATNLNVTTAAQNSGAVATQVASNMSGMIVYE